VTLGENPSLWIRKYILAAGLPKNDFLFPAKSRRRAAATTEQPAAGGDLAKFESKRPELYSNFREKVWTSILADAGFATKVLSQRKYWRTGEKRPFDSWQPEFTPHQGRHFAASALIASGCAPKRLQAFLGRETLQVTMDVYGHLFPDQRADEDLADALDAQISNG
jgi:integrase